MSKPKPCPFCGGEPFDYNGIGPLFWYACTKCKAETRSAETPDEALEFWNRRFDVAAGKEGAS